MIMIEFGTGGWRAIIGDLFTRENIRRVACALARRMHREGVADIGMCIGYDRRFLSRESAIWFSEVMAGEGVRVYFVNLSAPTPQIMFTVKHMALPYGAAITASHNPAIYNGIKLFTRGGRDATQDVTDPIGEEANAISAEDIRSVDFDKARAQGLITFIDPRDAYLDSIMAQIDMDAIRARRPRIEHNAVIRKPQRAVRQRCGDARKELRLDERDSRLLPIVLDGKRIVKRLRFPWDVGFHLRTVRRHRAQTLLHFGGALLRARRSAGGQKQKQKQKYALSHSIPLSFFPIPMRERGDSMPSIRHM